MKCTACVSMLGLNKYFFFVEEVCLAWVEERWNEKKIDEEEEGKAKQKMKKAASDEIKNFLLVYYFANNNITEIKIVFISFFSPSFLAFGRGKSVNKDWINKKISTLSSFRLFVDPLLGEIYKRMFARDERNGNSFVPWSEQVFALRFLTQSLLS